MTAYNRGSMALLFGARIGHCLTSYSVSLQLPIRLRLQVSLEYTARRYPVEVLVNGLALAIRPSILEKNKMHVD